MLPTMVTRRKKIAVSALFTLRGLISENSTGQIRENASIIFTNFVGFSCLGEILGLTNIHRT